MNVFPLIVQTLRIPESVWLALIGIIALIVKEVIDQRRMDRMKDQVEKIEHNTDGMQAELQRFAREEGRASGAAQERESRKDEPSDVIIVNPDDEPVPVTDIQTRGET